MAIVRVRNNKSGDISHIGEEWLERWPEDFTLAPEGDEPEGDQEPTTGGAPALPDQPSNGKSEKEK
jgi:hypothetical protein